jgi:hypothetical protein
MPEMRGSLNDSEDEGSPNAKRRKVKNEISENAGKFVDKFDVRTPSNMNSNEEVGATAQAPEHHAPHTFTNDPDDSKSSKDDCPEEKPPAEDLLNQQSIISGIKAESECPSGLPNAIPSQTDGAEQPSTTSSSTVECGGAEAVEVVCPHGQRWGNGCRECELSQLCQHGRIRRRCAACRGLAPPCPHGARRATCPECRQCQHGRRRERCADCRGSQVPNLPTPPCLVPPCESSHPPLSMVC